MDDYQIGSRPIIKIINTVLIIISIIAFISLLLQFGFYLPRFLDNLIDKVNLIIIQFYLLQFIIKMFCSVHKFRYLRSHWFEAIICVLIIIDTFWLIKVSGRDIFNYYIYDKSVGSITNLYIIIAQIIIVLSFIPGFLYYNQSFSKLKIHPAKLTIISFAFIIITGALLLCLPKAVTQPNKISFIDALFTATSAVCVTGLAVVDTGTYFSLFGQIVILFLIQIGGLGLMTFAIFFSLLFGKGIAIKEKLLMVDIMSVDNMGLISSMIKKIIITVFSCELIGAVSLIFFWRNEGWPVIRLVYNSVFHSVSAFCNAGFSLFSDSLMKYHDNTGVILTIGFLIISGGIGFLVMLDLFGIIKKIFGREKRKKVLLRIHTKIVLITTLVLIISGAVIYLIVEKNPEDYNLKTRLLSAFFTSVTARTAGYNSIDFGKITMPLALAVIVLMYIGASPGSTGGGIKTASFAALWIGIYSILTGKRRIVLFKKNIPFVVMNRAMIVFIFSITLISTCVILLSITEKFSFLDILFEEVSAFGTVGLSRGITPMLSSWGKSIIIATMFIGRIGILTMAYAVSIQKFQPLKVEYPSEMINIG